jgi:hypothetical protein
LLVLTDDKPDRMEPDAVTSTSSASNLASREQLEVEYLRRLFARDADIWRERMSARDSIVSKAQVRRVNPTYRSEQPARESVSPFEDSYSVGRLT